LLLEKLAFSSNTELAVPTTKGLCHWRFQSSSDLDDTISDSNVYKLSKIDFSFDMAFFAGSEPSIHTISVWQLTSSDNSTGALDKYVSSRYDITSVVISPDSSVVASSSFDTAVTLWRTDTGQRCQIFTGPIQVTAITFSHDSSIMVTCDTKRILRFWQTATGECINVSSMLECNTAKASDWGYIIHHMAASADLGILALGGYDVIFVLRKDNDKAYKCIAQYPAPKKANRSMYIEHVAVSLTSAFVSWASAEYSEDSKENQLILEHWRIDTENAIELHVGHRHRSISYQEKNNGLIIPGHKYWLRTLATGRFAWITQKEERLLWIPKEFRPRSAWHWDSSGSILAIGGNANIVLIIDFSRQPDTIVSEQGGVESLKRKTRASSFGVITETMFEEEENV
jgi:WD40 repeat protein